MNHVILFKIAWRNVWRNKLRSAVVISAIVLGIWAGVFVFAFATGMNNQRTRDMLKSVVSHVQIHDSMYLQEDLEVGYTFSGQDLFPALDKNDKVKAYTPRLKTLAFATTAHGSSGGQLIGVDPEQESQVTDIAQRLTKGKYLKGTKGNALLVGKSLAKKLKLDLKKSVVMRFQDAKGQQIAANFKVVGIYESISSTYDENTLFCRYSDLANLLQTPNAFHEVALWLGDVQHADEVAQQLAQSLPKDLKIETWKEVSPELGYSNEMMSMSLYIVIGIILVGLLGGIVNTMLMAILERKRELGMILCVGMNKTKVFVMILYETIFLSLIGGPLGVLLGYATVAYFGQNGIDLSSIEEGMAAFGMSTMVYPEIATVELFRIVGLVILTAIIGAIVPGRKAIQLKPAEAVRAI